MTLMLACFQVQVAARETLAEFFLQFQGSERLVIPTLCDLLTTPPPQVTEEQFKVSLLSLGRNVKSIYGFPWFKSRGRFTIFVDCISKVDVGTAKPSWCLISYGL